MFEQLSEKIAQTMKKLAGNAKIREANVRDAVHDIRLNLLEADVNYQVVKAFTEGVEQKALGREVLESLTPGQHFVKIVRDELISVMGGGISEIDLKRKPPIVIALIGLQGSGKTTTAGKLAKFLVDHDRRQPYLVPADVYRPAAIEQLKKLAVQISIPVYETRSGDDPVKVCRRAVDEATRRGEDVVILDTAGRVTVDQEMMKELERIKSKVRLDEVILVADAMSGQDAVNVAKAFHDRLSITGVILTKMDGDARGGAALSIRYVVGCPIYFVGEGEQLDALTVFHPDRIAERILGMGDVLTLIERVEKEVDEHEAIELAEKIRKEDFSLQDFLDQLRMVKKFGSMESVMGLMPGMGAVKKNINFDELETKLKRTEAIISSMTRGERQNVAILDGSRRKRIAKGSGTKVEDVNRVLKEYLQMKKMMKKLSSFGMRGLGKLFQRFR